MIDINRVLTDPQQVLKFIDGVDLRSSIIYIAGSLLEGFGNERSDLDVFVVFKTKTERFGKKSKSLQESFTHQEGIFTHNIIQQYSRFDIEYWPWSRVENVVNAINDLDVTTNEHLPWISDLDYDFLHRLKYAQPIINEHRFTTFVNSIQYNNLSYYHATTKIRMFAGILDDVEGAILSKDFGTAFFQIRGLLNCCMDAYLALHGETNPNEKWLYKKIERYEKKYDDKPLKLDYLKFHNMPFRESTLEKYMIEVVTYCQKLNDEVQSELRKIQSNQQNSKQGFSW